MIINYIKLKKKISIVFRGFHTKSKEVIHNNKFKNNNNKKYYNKKNFIPNFQKNKKKFEPKIKTSLFRKLLKRKKIDYITYLNNWCFSFRENSDVSLKIFPRFQYLYLYNNLYLEKNNYSNNPFFYFNNPPKEIKYNKYKKNNKKYFQRPLIDVKFKLYNSAEKAFEEYNNKFFLIVQWLTNKKAYPILQFKRLPYLCKKELTDLYYSFYTKEQISRFRRFIDQKTNAMETGKFVPYSKRVQLFPKINYEKFCQAVFEVIKNPFFFNLDALFGNSSSNENFTKEKKNFAHFKFIRNLVINSNHPYLLKYLNFFFLLYVNYFLSRRNLSKETRNFLKHIKNLPFKKGFFLFADKLVKNKFLGNELKEYFFFGRTASYKKWSLVNPRFINKIYNLSYKKAEKESKKNTEYDYRSLFLFNIFLKKNKRINWDYILCLKYLYFFGYHAPIFIKKYKKEKRYDKKIYLESGFFKYRDLLLNITRAKKILEKKNYLKVKKKFYRDQKEFLKHRLGFSKSFELFFEKQKIRYFYRTSLFIKDFISKASINFLLKKKRCRFSTSEKRVLSLLKYVNSLQKHRKNYARIKRCYFLKKKAQVQFFKNKLFYINKNFFNKYKFYLYLLKNVSIGSKNYLKVLKNLQSDFVSRFFVGSVSSFYYKNIFIQNSLKTLDSLIKRNYDRKKLKLRFMNVLKFDGRVLRSKSWLRRRKFLFRKLKLKKNNKNFNFLNKNKKKKFKNFLKCKIKFLLLKKSFFLLYELFSKFFEKKKDFFFLLTPSVISRHLDIENLKSNLVFQFICNKKKLSKLFKEYSGVQNKAIFELLNNKKNTSLVSESFSLKFNFFNRMQELLYLQKFYSRYGKKKFFSIFLKRKQSFSFFRKTSLFFALYSSFENRFKYSYSKNCGIKKNFLNKINKGQTAFTLLNHSIFNLKKKYSNSIVKRATLFNFFTLINLALRENKISMLESYLIKYKFAIFQKKKFYNSRFSRKKNLWKPNAYFIERKRYTINKKKMDANAVSNFNDMHYFVGCMIKCGLKNKAIFLFTKAISIFVSRLKKIFKNKLSIAIGKQRFFFLLSSAVDRVTPPLILMQKTIAGKKHKIPYIAPIIKRRKMAIRWIIKAAKNSGIDKGKNFSEKLASELIDILRNKGSALKIKDEYCSHFEKGRQFLRFIKVF